MYRIFSLSTLLFCILITTCTDNKLVTISNNGKLKGLVYLLDPLCKKRQYHPNTLVEIKNTGYTTTTDSSGYWELDQIPQGSYTIIFSHEGYGNYHEIFTQINIGTQQDTLINYLYYLPTATTLNLYFKDHGTFYEFPTWTPLNTIRESICHHLFINDRLPVSKNPAEYKFETYKTNEYNLYDDRTYDDYFDPWISPIYKLSFDGIFALQDTLYAIFYEGRSDQYYVDLVTGKKVYTTLNLTHSNIVQFLHQ